jgi:Kae1-associated kinase Bud32
MWFGVTKKILYRGAEAEIRLSEYMGLIVIEKRRIKKNYRIKNIDSRLISYRTKEEAKLMTEARLYGISVPIIYDVDLRKGIIVMEYLVGDRIKDIIDKISHEERIQICNKIGKSIARFHNNDIIHGDITTSNMIFLDNRVHFIDFGLGEKNNDIETKGVDLHVLMEALESTHSKNADCFNYVIEGYREEYKGDTDKIVKKIEDIVRRGRYR